MDVSNKTIHRYSASEVVEQCGLSAHHLSQLKDAGLVRPQKSSKSKYGRNYYTFQDLTVIHNVVNLLSRGASFANIKSAYLSVMHRGSGRLEHASSIRLVKDARYFEDTVLLAQDNELVDPKTGERVFDFSQSFQPKRSQRIQTLESIRVAQKVHGDSDNTHDWFDYALDCEDAHDFEEARRAYEKSIHCDSGNADAWVNLGRLHFANGRQLDSMHCYQEALEFDENHTIAHYNLGVLYNLFESTEKAIFHLTQAEGIPEAIQCLAAINREQETP